eukprot:3375288-Rhodomonas_salina.1
MAAACMALSLSFCAREIAIGNDNRVEVGPGRANAGREERGGARRAAQGTRTWRGLRCRQSMWGLRALGLMPALRFSRGYHHHQHETRSAR